MRWKRCEEEEEEERGKRKMAATTHGDKFLPVTPSTARTSVDRIWLGLGLDHYKVIILPSHH